MTMRGIGRGEGFGRLLRFPLSMLIVAGLALGGERLALAQTSDDGDATSVSESSAPSTESVGPAPLTPELDAAGVDDASAEETTPSADALPADDATAEEDAEPAAMAALAASATAGSDQGSIAERSCWSSRRRTSPSTARSRGDRIIVDTTGMSESNVAAIREMVGRVPAADRVRIIEVPF